MKLSIYILLILFCVIQHTISVSIPPTITKQSEDYVLPFREGYSTQIECEATGSEVQYDWIKNDENFNPSGQDDRYFQTPGSGTITIKDAEKKDEGFYQCKARVKRGQQELIALTNKVQLRYAYLGSVSLAERPIRKMATKGKKLVLPCSKPSSWPNEQLHSGKHFKMYWTQAGKNIILTNRVSQSIYGDLYFANIIKEDELKETETDQRGVYECSAQNMVMQKTVVVKKYWIDINQDSQVVTNPVAREFNSPTQPEAKMGERLKLQCFFSGSPTPTVLWEKNNPISGEAERITQSRRIILRQFGNELEINNVTKSDEGTYLCKGTNANTATKIPQQFTVSVISKPYFFKDESIHFMKDTTLGVNQTARFMCTAEAYPRANYKWSINGVELNDVNLAKMPNGNRIKKSEFSDIGYFGSALEIINLKESDTSVVQCNASNAYGYAFMNAYVNVLNELPTWKLKPVQLMKVASGQSALLNCQTFGAPKPIVSWTKEGTELGGAKFRILDNGDLNITLVTPVDAGLYICEAKNRLGSVQAESSIIVRQKTRIVKKPREFQTVAGTTIKFQCSGTTDNEEMGKLVIKWKKDGKEIDFDLETRITQDLADNALIISGTNVLDSGEYTCVATNGLDSDEKSSSLTVRDVPERATIDPKQFKCDSGYQPAKDSPFYGYQHAKVQWSPGKDNNVKILQWIVEYNTSDDMSLWRLAAITNSTLNVYVPLLPHQKYAFRVRARNYIGISLPSDFYPKTKETFCQAPEKRANVAVTGARTLNWSPKRLVIAWNPVNPLNYYGTKFKYSIKYRNVAPLADQDICGGDPVCTGHVKSTTKMLANPFIKDQRWMDASYMVINPTVPFTKPYQPFFISLNAANSPGESQETNSFYGFSGEDVPLDTVEGLSYDENSLRNGQVRLTWTAIDTSPERVRGFFKGFLVEIIRLDKLGGSSGTAGFGSRVPTRQYKIIRKDYPESQTRLSAAEWAHYENKVSKPDASKPQIDNPTSYVIDYLPGAARLQVTIRIMNKGYYGAPSQPLTIPRSGLTPESIPGPVQELQAKEVGANHVVLKWASPDEPNGQITAYGVEYQEIHDGLILGARKPLGNMPANAGPNPSSDGRALRKRRAAETESGKPKIFSSGVNEAYVMGLHANSQYRLSLWAINKAGEGEKNFLHATTVDPAAPSSPTMKVEETGERWVKLQWFPLYTSPSPGSVFFVQYRMEGIEAWDRTVEQSDMTEFNLTDLLPGTAYQVRVVAKTGDFHESSSIIHEFTTEGDSHTIVILIGQAWFIFAILFILAFCAFVFLICFVRRQQSEDEDEGYETKPQQPPGSIPLQPLSGSREHQQQQQQPHYARSAPIGSHGGGGGGGGADTGSQAGMGLPPGSIPRKPHQPGYGDDPYGSGPRYRPAGAGAGPPGPGQYPSSTPFGRSGGALPPTAQSEGTRGGRPEVNRGYQPDSPNGHIHKGPYKAPMAAAPRGGGGTEDYSPSEDDHSLDQTPPYGTAPVAGPSMIPLHARDPQGPVFRHAAAPSPQPTFHPGYEEPEHMQADPKRGNVSSTSTSTFV